MDPNFEIPHTAVCTNSRASFIAKKESPLIRVGDFKTFIFIKINRLVASLTFPSLVSR